MVYAGRLGRDRLLVSGAGGYGAQAHGARQWAGAPDLGATRFADGLDRAADRRRLALRTGKSGGLGKPDGEAFDLRDPAAQRLADQRGARFYRRQSIG